MAWPVLIAVGIVAVAEWACSRGEEPSRDVIPDAYSPDLLKPDATEDAGTDQDIPERPDIKDSGSDEYVGDADTSDSGQELDYLICGDCDVTTDETITDTPITEDIFETCEDAGIDQGTSDEGLDISSDEGGGSNKKRAVVNCPDDDSIEDCWTRLTRIDYQANEELNLSIRFVDSTEPCGLEAGIKLCLSTAITTCPEDTPIDIGSPEFEFVTSYYEGAQNLFASTDGEIELRVDATTDPLMLALRVSGIEGPDGECVMLWNTFECANVCE